MGRGAEGVHIVSIVRALERLGHQVTILSPPGIDPLANWGAAPLDKSQQAKTNVTGFNRLWKMISRNAPEALFEIFEILYNIYAWIRLKKIIKERSIDAIYERYAFFLVAGAFVAKSLNIPHILEVNEVSSIPRARPQTLSGLANRMEFSTFSRASAIVTVSSFLKNGIEARLGGKALRNVHVLPNAIEPSRFSFSSSRDEIRNKYSLGDSVVFGFAGWFDVWDRLDFLIETFARFHANTPKSALLLIGDGKDRQHLEQLISKNKLEKCVHLTGAVPRPEVLHYLDAVDVAVFAHSNSFGSPIVLFEFMALGKPVIGPKLGPILDVIHQKENGLLFDPLNEAQLYDCLSILANDNALRSSLGQSARKITYERYTWDNNARFIEEAIMASRRMECDGAAHSFS
jgi:glycosyltransferase involved in cell wall biosynthesis